MRVVLHALARVGKRRGKKKRKKENRGEEWKMERGREREEGGRGNEARFV